MLKDALEYLFNTGRASAPAIVAAGNEPPHVYYLRQADGTLVRTEAARHPANSLAASLQPIVQACAAHCALGEKVRPQVWYAIGAVVCLTGESLRDRLTLRLELSEPLAALCDWKSKNRPLTQADMVRALRTTFANSTGQAEELAAAVKKLKFNATASGDSEIDHGRQSLGKSLTAQITGEKAIPETVIFNFQTFTNACFRGIRASVKCAIEVDASTTMFKVTALPGELERAADDAVSEIAKQLASAFAAHTPELEVDLYHGSPA